MLNDGYYTDFGDEFILSLAADKNKEKIKNAAPYIFRFWTGDFRLVSTSYKFNPITIIHVPDEKNSGILKIYDYIVKHEKLPRLSKVHLILHLKHRKIKTLIKEIIKKLIKR